MENKEEHANIVSPIKSALKRTRWCTVNNSGYADPEIMSLARVLKDSSTIHGIDISDNPITDTGLGALANVIPTFKMLNYLYLYRTHVTEKGLVYLFNRLKEIHTLKQLDIRWLPLDQACMITLDEVITQNPDIELLITYPKKMLNFNKEPFSLTHSESSESFESVEALNRDSSLEVVDKD